MEQEKKRSQERQNVLGGSPDKSLFFDEYTRQYTPINPYTWSTENIHQQIRQILSQRREHANQLSDSESLLTSLSNDVKRFSGSLHDTFPTREKAAALMEGMTPEETDRFMDRLQQVASATTDELSGELQEIAQMIHQAKKRFERQNICLAIVGNAGEGKSTLIQNITGLNEDTIPTSSGGICTAARSEIRNENIFQARIYFYTMTELMNDVIAPYFVHFGCNPEELSLRTMGDVIDQFQTLSPGDAKLYYERLEWYIKAYDTYKHLIGHMPMTLTDPSEVRQYVSQRDVDSKDMNYFLFLAVKYVEIDCPFPTTDVSHLILVDTVGVNEPTLNIKQQMFRTIRDSADFVLYVKKTVRDRSNWLDRDDMQLYFDILSSLPSIPASKWVYFVFNYIKEYDSTGTLLENSFLPNVDRVLQAIHPDDTMRFPGACINVNCTDRAAVTERLIMPMLSHLATNLPDIDASLVAAINEKIQHLNAQYQLFIHTLNGLRLNYRDDSTIRIRCVNDLHRSFVKKMSEQRAQCCREIRENYSHDNWREIACAMTEDIDSKIPDRAYIESLYHGNASALRTIEEVYAMTRTRLHCLFDETGDMFTELVADAKHRCVKMFLDAMDLNNSTVLRTDPNAPNAMFLIAEELFVDPAAEILKQAFRSIDSLTIDYGRTLSQSMTEITKVIDPNRGDGNIPSHWDRIGLPEAIIEMLRSRMDGIRTAIMERINGMDQPEEMVINVINAFATNITQTGGVQEAWQVTLMPLVTRMYPDQFSSMKKRNRDAEYWNSILDALTHYEELPQITFR